MKLLKILSLTAIFLVSISFVSCKTDKKESAVDATKIHMEEDGHTHQATQQKMSTSGMNTDKNMQTMEMHGKTGTMMTHYLAMKNALVSDDSKAAVKAGKALHRALLAFNTSRYTEEQQKELKEIIDDAAEHAEHISDAPIDHQREHFISLSQDMIDMLAITGSENKLYQAFCPMADNNKGAVWISEMKTIKNPFMGSKMMTCGEIQKEL